MTFTQSQLERFLKQAMDNKDLIESMKEEFSEWK